MANYPFKINIQKGNGNQLSFYTSSFANSGQTQVSASTIVNRITSMPKADTYIQSEEAATTSSGVIYSNSFQGSHFLGVSTNESNTGSIIFTDTETTLDGGLDFYTFWGTKVCSTLGIPEGIPIYTENFRLSDDSSNPDNYLSGDVIADSVSIKNGFKISPQGRMRSNLVWDDVFGEGLLQWVSGSASKLTIGYDDVSDEYKIGFATGVTSKITGLDQLTMAGEANTTIQGATILKSTDTIYHSSADVVILSGRTTYDESVHNKGQLKIDTSGDNVMTGQLRINDTEASTAASTNAYTDYTLMLRNSHGDAIGDFAGIGFDAGTTQNSDAIAGSIIVARDNSTTGLHDGNMIFATNDDADDDLTERMRIHHDGGVKISKGLGVGTDGPTTVGLIRATNDVVAFYSSDERLKDNLIKIGNPLDKISQLNGYEFDWIEKQGIHENEGHDVGVVAQEVERVIPEIVETRENGYKAVRYEKMVPLLIESIKEQQEQISELKREVKELKNG